ncbi:MAG TPA: hypothetical protein ENK83_08320 [Aliiroseovarius sp.]|nr:hypothetical protein [Aliiroseovarius sp.]
MKSIFFGIGLAGSIGAAAMGQEAPDFSTYMQSSQALSAIASAVDSAGGCSVPLEFDERRENGQVVLGVHCRGTEDDEISIFVTFMDDGYSLLPLRFDYAG